MDVGVSKIYLYWEYTLLFTVGHIAILLPAQTNLSEKMEPLWCHLWQGGRAAGQSVTTPPPTPTPPHTPTHPTSSAAAAVSSRNNVFPKTQLRKDLLLGFLNLFQLTQVYHSSAAGPFLRFAIPASLTHSPTHHLWSLQLWENSPLWESKVNTCEKRLGDNFICVYLGI